MTLQQKLVRADDYLDMLKDKAKETDELAKENLQLRIDYQQANDIIVEQSKEIVRLNNTINSIENEVRNTTEEMYKTLVKIDGRGYYVANLTRLDYLLDKIKELKGDDKE